MPVAPGPSRRFVLLLIGVSAFLCFFFVASFRNQAQGVRHPLANGSGSSGRVFPDTAQAVNGEVGEISQATLDGHVIAPKLGNATIKAELGRAAWKVLHTTFARFPDKPTKDESAALKSYIHLFQRLYPCGECAAHFRHFLDKFPPQVSSRSAAAAWGCHIHNEVNKSLKKDLFDCSQIGDFYDCGCAEDETTEGAKLKSDAGAASKEQGSSEKGQQFGEEMLTGDTPLKLEQEGYGRGG
ncbi:hypothetical protein AAFC00_000260 [Neodothiora populina]|uniref:Sulfhydryl oxidase n=1 Tax=Neodothiora populina TaxID=2781224 RepID=A0ABR3PCE4_9PEZI